MNKQEIAAVIVMFLLLLGWGYYSRSQVTPAETDWNQGVSEESATPDEETKGDIDPALIAEEAVPERVAPVVTEIKETAISAVDEPAKAAPADTKREFPEVVANLANETTTVSFSSWGGAITSVELRKYRESHDPESGPVILDFSSRPALSFSDIPGLSTHADFSLSVDDYGKSIRIERTTEQGLNLVRTVTLSDGYTLSVVDTFSNVGNETVTLPDYHGVAVGPMHMIKSKAKTRGKIPYLGLDTKATGSGFRVVHWAKKGPDKNNKRNIAKRFQVDGGGGFMRKTPLQKPLPHTITVNGKQDTDWLAAKNKFFVQILASEEPCIGYALNADRLVPDSEDPSDQSTWSRGVTVAAVSGVLKFREQSLTPGASFTRQMSYYAGPKEYSRLEKLGNQQDEVMFYAWSGWGWFRTVCTWLLWTLNAINSVIPNYGVAIILLTIIVKIIFWPVTHKSTESMKKMQKIQPLVKEIREKYKDKPQKVNQEVMALYKVHKVNPMAGCLPMVVQIPVFIALFTVLRSAVELRFAEFLWIGDLSEPEGLFADVLPIPLNILPILMTVTMIWQQRLTPSSGDPQQQKMMMFMPVFMLFIFYPMASALVLYWTTSQCLSIIQLLIQKRMGKKKEDQEEAEAA